MREKQFSFLSSNRESTVRAFLFEPGTEPKAVLQICHGMCEYLDRYRPLAGFLTDNGIAVTGCDHLGHGHTAESNAAPYGYFGPAGSWERLVEDQELLRRKTLESLPPLPYFLLGHSMGSFVARLYAARYGERLTALVLSGTAGRNPAAGAGRLVVRLVERFRGELAHSDLLRSLTVGGYNRSFHDGTAADWLTRDRAVCEAYLADRRCSFTFTVGGYRELLELLVRSNAREWYRRLPKDLPILLYSGARDPVGNFGKGVRQVRDELRATGHADVKLTLYPDGRHEMHNELNREEVFADLLRFLTDHLPPA